MCPDGKMASKFYCNFKIHKEHVHIPPVRPIISGSGSIVENPSKFIDFHIKDLATSHKSYLQDTPYFIRKIEHINKNHKLPQNAMLVTLDVIALYTNIPQHEGTQATEQALNERENQSMVRIASRRHSGSCENSQGLHHKMGQIQGRFARNGQGRAGGEGS